MSALRKEFLWASASATMYCFTLVVIHMSDFFTTGQRASLFFGVLYTFCGLYHVWRYSSTDRAETS